MKIASGLAAAAMLTIGFARAARADQVVQVPVDALLNARAVTTLTGGRLVPWTVGIDGNGLADGYMTAAASKFHNDPATLKTLPDDGRFLADARHPDVLLHFSNDADAASQQTHYVRGAGTFTFAIPAGTYSKMFLFVTSSEGSSALKITMTYSDAMDVVNLRMPSPDEAKSLDLGPGTPVILVARTAYAVGNRPVELCDTTIAADRYELLYDISAQ